MVLATDFLDILWSMLIFFLWVAWFMQRKLARPTSA